MNVKASLVGFLMLDLIVRPTVEGNLEVNFCRPRDESLIWCWPRMISRGCSLEACIAGRIPENKTINIAIPEICSRIGVTSAGSIIGIPSILSYILSMAGAPRNTPRIVPNKHPIKPMMMGLSLIHI